jgi:hypothetical protein
VTAFTSLSADGTVTYTWTSYSTFFTADTDAGGCGCDETLFLKKFPRWEAYATYFQMVRYVMTARLTQRCATSSVTASKLDNYLSTGPYAVPNGKFAGQLVGGDYPQGEGAWFIDSFNVEDSHDGFSNCSLTLRTSGRWEHVKIGTGTPTSPS